MWKEISQRFRRVKQRLKSIRGGRKKTFYFLSHDSDGITIRSLETATKKLPWIEISSIHAFKRDLMTVDLICIQIAMRNGVMIVIHEEMDGWMEVIECLPDYLPGCKKWEAWWMAVAFPAFVTNYTEIYNRQTENTNFSSSENLA